MDAKELRIGNIVSYKDEVFQIDGIQPGWVWFKSDGTMRSDSLSDVKPIPLSPEVLEACGFIKSRDGYIDCWWHGHNPITQDFEIIIKYSENYRTFFYLNAHHKLKYLHQLQNLYYSLTGSELQVTLTQKVWRMDYIR